MIEAIDGAERSREYFTRYLSRSGCHPCDRSEAGHQLSTINKKIDELNYRLQRLEDEYRE